MIDMIEWMTHMMMMMIDPLIFDTHTRIVWVFKEFTNNNNRNSIQFNSKWNIILAPSFIAKKTCIIHTQWMNEMLTHTYWPTIWSKHDSLIIWSLAKNHQISFLPVFFLLCKRNKKKTSLCPDSNKQKKTIFSIRFNNRQ